MAQSLNRFASFLRPIGKGTNELVVVKLHTNSLTVAEVRHKFNVINAEHLASPSLPPKFDLQKLTRQ